MSKSELKTIEILAKSCDRETAIELNRRLQAILDWVEERLRDSRKREGKP